MKMKTQYLEPETMPVELRELFSQAFAEYHGNKFAITTIEPEAQVSFPPNYWDGGSRTYATFVLLHNGKTGVLPDNHPFFNRNGLQGSFVLPRGVAMVTNSILCGKDMGLTATVRADDLNPAMLPDAEFQFALAERIVLHATRSLKSSYAGISNYRFHEAHRATGINWADWNNAKQSLVESGHLNKAGAITPSGRNAAQGYDWPKA